MTAHLIFCKNIDFFSIISKIDAKIFLFFTKDSSINYCTSGSFVPANLSFFRVLSRLFGKKW